MPGFVRSKKDESVWAKAKKAAAKSKGKEEGSFSDNDWALTNHIYHKMKKSTSLSQEILSTVSMLKSSNKFSVEEIKEALIKIRQKINDDDEDENESYDPYSDEEEDPYYDPYSDEDQGEELREFDPDQDDPYSEGSESSEYQDEDTDSDNDPAASWLKQQSQKQKVQPAAAVAPREAQSKATPISQVEETDTPSRWYQPTREEIAELRRHTVPWEKAARMRGALSAIPTKNPVIAHQGELIATRQLNHADRQKAYQEFTNSPEYKNASTIQRIKMDRKFNQDWLEKNPTHIHDAIKAHGEAHKKGEAGKEAFEAVKEANMLNVLRGGAQAEAPMSMEEAMQHVGGVKEDDVGTVGSTQKDPATAFAAANKDFIKDFASYYDKQRGKRAKTPMDENDMMNFDRRSEQDIKRILGSHADIKDPAAKAKFDDFFKKYYPLIGMSAKRVINELQMNKKDVDYGALDEAGMHGLIKAVNRYDHDHPKKASFATHAGSLIRGEMKNALAQLREQSGESAVPAELRRAAKRLERAGGARVGADQPQQQPKVVEARAPVPPAPAPAQPEATPEKKSPQVLVRRFRDPSAVQRLQMTDSLKTKKPQGQE